MNRPKIGVIGCGNMGQALIQGMLKARFVTPSGVIVSDADSKKLTYAVKSFRARKARSNKEVAASRIVLLAVKPQQMEEVLSEIRSHIAHRPLIISIAAGISTSWIEKRLGDRATVVRVMPNTPALVGAGASAIAPGRLATQSSLTQAEKIFSCVGSVVRVPERWMNAVTAVSGSGPAYFFYLMERMIKAGVALGLSDEAARRLVLQTAFGAAVLAGSSMENPADLRARVTSKGGTTEAAFKSFDQSRLGEKIEKGIRAAAARAKQLGG
jgi:pyrroline-5-carboxylate reductase